MAYSIDTLKYKDKNILHCKKRGINLNLENPKTIQDKLVWLNLYDTDPLKVKCADKIKVHEYCKEKLGEDICIPILKIYNNVNEINFDELPKQFVIKCNHGSGMNIIVKDKSTLNIKEACSQLSKWMADDFAFRNGFEAHYHDIERRILVEEYKEENGKVPSDYKILCFNGVPKIIQVIGGRFDSTKHLNYYDLDFKFLDICRTDFKSNPSIKDRKPINLKLMIEYAEKLSKDFKFVRVDFYEVNGRVYLGELTFTPGACGFKYTSENKNVEMGKMLDISKK